jgi:hypothetical protein
MLPTPAAAAGRDDYVSCRVWTLASIVAVRSVTDVSFDTPLGAGGDIERRLINYLPSGFRYV